METKKGIQVSPGVAISRAVVIDAEAVPIPRRTVAAELVAREHGRLDQAIEGGIQDSERLRERAEGTLGTELARIFDFHTGMLRDEHLIGQIRQLIDGEHVTAEYAVYFVMRRQAEMLSQLTDRYYRDRVHDMWDVERLLLHHLIGHTRAELGHLQHEAVVIAHDLTPSQTASMDKSRIKGIATDAGGPTSHTAILAHALGIPAVVGLENVTQAVNTGDTVIIDGNHGEVLVDPTAGQLMEYRAYVQRMAVHEVSLDELATLPAVTKDGVAITIEANIEFPSEIGVALEKGATGIGLYRTEFLYLASDTEPTEEQHQAAEPATEGGQGRRGEAALEAGQATHDPGTPRHRDRDRGRRREAARDGHPGQGARVAPRVTDQVGGDAVADVLAGVVVEATQEPHQRMEPDRRGEEVAHCDPDQVP